uniref:Uncharacterized protein n=1 Tax=Caenorhabditis japonica TaxID=281687 RepID=A0A8R1ICF3_CAEJA
MIMTSPLFKEDTIQHCNIHRLAFWRHVNGSRADGLCGNKSGGYSRWQVAPQEVGPPSYPLGPEPSISKGGQDLQNDGRIIRKLINEEEEKFAEWEEQHRREQLACWELGNGVLPAEEEDQRGFKQGDVRKD